MQCQCLTRQGKGAQCSLKALSGSKFCSRHQQCQYYISLRKKEMTYFDILPLDLQRELVFYFTDDELFKICNDTENYPLLNKWCQLIIKTRTSKLLKNPFPLDVLLSVPLGYVIKYVIPQLQKDHIWLPALYPNNFPYLGLIKYLIAQNIENEDFMQKIAHDIALILRAAIERNANIEDIYFLLHVSPEIPFVEIISNNRLDILKYIFSNTNDEGLFRDALTYSILNDNGPAIDYLLKKSKDINMPQRNRDMYLSLVRSVETMQKLIDAGFYSEDAMWQFIAIRMSQSFRFDKFFKLLDAFPKYITTEQYTNVLIQFIEREDIESVKQYMPIFKKHVNIDTLKIRNPKVISAIRKYYDQFN